MLAYRAIIESGLIVGVKGDYFTTEQTRCFVFVVKEQKEVVPLAERWLGAFVTKYASFNGSDVSPIQAVMGSSLDYQGKDGDTYCEMLRLLIEKAETMIGSIEIQHAFMDVDLSKHEVQEIRIEASEAKKRRVLFMRNIVGRVVPPQEVAEKISALF
jgi:hypothetical protein